MPTLRVKISDLFQFEPSPLAAEPMDVTTITPAVLKQFGFLPQPLVITVEGDEVVLQFPEESSAAKVEANRLAERAAKRAAEGDFRKAIDLFKRVLELHPALHSARRDLAMAYVEVGDVESATSHLIDVLRVDPSDAWSLVVLANLYIREKSDLKTAESFLRKAIEIKPDDAWALNSLAAVCHQTGRNEDAIGLFEKAIHANPEFPNAYYGEAVVYEATNRSEMAMEVLKRLFARAKMQDARSRPVFEQARELFTTLQTEVAAKNQSDAFKCIQQYKSEMEGLSGYPIRIEEGEFDDKVGARIQMAWKHGRDYHLVTTRRGYAPELIAHLEAHELTHLKMESDARKIGKNQFFATTRATREIAIRSVSSELRRWKADGYSDESITKISRSLIDGLCGFLFNCPLDMLIERHIRNNFPVLHPAQLLSVRAMATEAWQTNSNPDVHRLTPRKIMNASLALNGAYCLLLDSFFEGATVFSAPYRRLDTYRRSEQLYRHWSERAESLGAGDEYRLVDEFADIVGLRDWYEWKPDPGEHQITATPEKSGTTNPELLATKHPAAVFYFLDAFARFDAMTPDEVKKVTFEIAILGQSGLDYASPEEKYRLRTIDDRSFSGLHLMCLMYAGFKRIAPAEDPGMDLNEPFLAALQLREQQRNK